MYIIAEVGSNWLNQEDLMNSIAMAKNCGADAVKFQLYDSKSLYGKEFQFKAEDYPWLLEPSMIPKLAEKAQACKIDFMCTPFSPEFMDVVDPYVKMHKIASSDLTYLELLEHAKTKEKPILLSVGGSSKKDIADALAVLQGSDVTLLYCCSAYPSRQHNLFYINWLKETFKVPVGFSDHSTDVIWAALSAKELGATVYEKHFKAWQGCEKNTPDERHSLDPTEFKIMTETLNGERSKNFVRSSEENEMITHHNRRLIVSQHVKRGDVLKYGKNFGCFRSLKRDTHGFNAFILMDKARTPEGKRASRDFAPGEAIGAGDYT